MLKDAIKKWLDIPTGSGRREMSRGNRFAGNFMVVSPFEDEDRNERFQAGLVACGINGIIGSHRAPDSSRFVSRKPKQGVPIVDDERELGAVVARIIALSQNSGRWHGHEFYYWARLGDMRQSLVWRALEEAAAHHGYAPALLRETDLWVFNGRDYWLAELRMVLGVGSTRHQLIARPRGGRDDLYFDENDFNDF